MWRRCWLFSTHFISNRNHDSIYLYIYITIIHKWNNLFVYIYIDIDIESSSSDMPVTYRYHLTSSRECRLPVLYIYIVLARSHFHEKLIYKLYMYILKIEMKKATQTNIRLFSNWPHRILTLNADAVYILTIILLLFSKPLSFIWIPYKLPNQPI